MASSQEDILSSEEKALVQKMKGDLDSVTSTISDQKMIALITLGNNAKRVVSLKEIRTFVGNWQDGGPPVTIPLGEYGHCAHESTLPEGCKVGVAYSAGGQRWIFALHVPVQWGPRTSEPPYNKVYFQHEEDSDVPIDWKDIEQKLDASTPPTHSIVTPYFYVNIWQHGGVGRFVGACREP